LFLREFDAFISDFLFQTQPALVACAETALVQEVNRPGFAGDSKL